MLENIEGHVVIVMGPMGSGKGTLIKKALETFPDIHETVSCTTRDPRPGEVDGKDYYFLTTEEFQRRIDEGEFLEWATFSGNQYGTLKSEIISRLEAGEVVIAEVDLQGVEQLQKLIPQDKITIIYIEAGGWENLKARALSRAAITEEALKFRHERYLIESAFKDKADIIVDNSVNDQSVAEKAFCEIIKTIKGK